MSLTNTEARTELEATVQRTRAEFNAANAALDEARANNAPDDEIRALYARRNNISRSALALPGYWGEDGQIAPEA